MTTFHSDLLPDRLLDAFLDHRQNWHPGEIQTLTGYDQSEYVGLRSRLSSETYTPSDVDAAMLKQAANTLRGLPTTSAEACEQFLGQEWRASLFRYLGDEPPR